MRKRAEGGLTILVILMGLVILGLLGYIFLLINNVTINGSSIITGNAVNDLQNCKYIKIPYQYQEIYDYYPKAKVIDVDKEEKIDFFGKGVYNRGIVTLKNTDNEATWFTVTFNWKTHSHYGEKDMVRHYIKPGNTVEFKSIYDNHFGEDTKFTYTYKSEPILKTRTTTKYQTKEVCN